MNKELKALHNLYARASVYCPIDEVGIILDELHTAGTALRNYDNIKNICKSYDIKFNLPNIREALFTFAQLKGEYGANWGNYNKKLRALEIIKNKDVDVALLKSILHADKSLHTASYYNSHFVGTYKHLTQEEFNLLKELLTNE